MSFAPLLPHLLPDGAQLAGHAATAAVVVGLTALGAGVGGGRRLPEADLVTGWGLAVIVITLAGTLTPVPFSGLLIGLGLAAAGAAVVRRGRIGPVGSGRVLVLMLPLLAVVAAMVPSQWDEYSHWLHSGRYLFDTDHFPGPGLPVSRATYPAYPYGLPLITYAASRLTGHLVESAVMVFNLALLASVALLVIRLVRSVPAGGAGAGRAEGVPVGGGGPSWRLVAAGWLAVTLLCPSFVPKVVFTAYAEVGTAAAVAVAGVLGWLALERQGAGDGAGARTLAWQTGLALAVLIALKQATLALVLGIALSLTVVVLRDRLLWRAATLGLAVMALAPAVVVQGAWRAYVAANLPGREFAVSVPADWNWALLPTVIERMGGVALHKSGLFTLMLVLMGLGLRGLVRNRTPFDRLAVVVGGTCGAYTVFLAWSYIAIFHGSEAETIASYWRYTMHLGLLATAAGVYGLTLVVRRRQVVGGRMAAWLSGPGLARLGTAAVVIALAAPVAAADKIRFDVRPNKMFVRAVAAEMRTLLPAGAQVVMVDPLDVGFYRLLVDYGLGRQAAVIGTPVNAYIADQPAMVRTALMVPGASHVFVHTQTDAIRPLLPLALTEGAAHLVSVEPGGAWRLIKSWPYPGYRQPTDIPDK